MAQTQKRPKLRPPQVLATIVVGAVFQAFLCAMLTRGYVTEAADYTSFIVFMLAVGAVVGLLVSLIQRSQRIAILLTLGICFLIGLAGFFVMIYYIGAILA